MRYRRMYLSYLSYTAGWVLFSYFTAQQFQGELSQAKAIELQMVDRDRLLYQTKINIEAVSKSVQDNRKELLTQTHTFYSLLHEWEASLSPAARDRLVLERRLQSLEARKANE